MAGNRSTSKPASEARLKLGAAWQAHDLIFCSEQGTPLSIPNLTYRYFRPILEKAELPRIRLYDLRHTCATLLLIAEENPKVVSERLGHSTIVLTLDTYSHVLPTMQQSATARLEKMLYSDFRTHFAHKKVNNAHTATLTRSGVRRFRLYDLRHTWATRAAMAGVDLVTLAAMLGHSRVQMVMRYAHPTEEHQFNAMKKVQTFVAGGLKK